MTEGLFAVAEQLPTAGAIIWWRLGPPVPAERLRIVWTEAGLDPSLLPALPDPRRALARAVAEMREKRRLVRPLDRKGEFRWAIVDETADDGELHYFPALRAKVQGERVVFDGGSYELAERVLAAYRTHRDTYAPEDLSSWLVRLSERLHAVALRETGGIYFVPAQRAPTWHAYAAAVRTATDYRLYEVPALRSEDAVEAILDALVARVEGETEVIDREIANGELGQRAIAARREATQGIAAQVSEYEALLGRKLDTLRQRVETVRGALVDAALSAAAEDDAA